MRKQARHEQSRAIWSWLVFCAGACALLSGCDATTLQSDLSTFGADFLRQALAAYLL